MKKEVDDAWWFWLAMVVVLILGVKGCGDPKKASDINWDLVDRIGQFRR